METKLFIQTPSPKKMLIFIRFIFHTMFIQFPGDICEWNCTVLILLCSLYRSRYSTARNGLTGKWRPYYSSFLLIRDNRINMVLDLQSFFSSMCTAALYRNFETYISIIEIARPRSQCVWERFIYSHEWSYLESEVRREGQGTASKQWLAAVPCPPLCSCGWAESSHKWPTYKFPIWEIMDHKWKQLNLVVNSLFGLRVNEK